MQTVDRFQSKVEMIPGFDCHFWSGAMTKNGYGKFGKSGGGGWNLAHRVAYEQKFGEISSGLYACHKCDNRLCVNPDHIFLGTAKDNAADRDAKKRRVALKGEEHGRNKLKSEQVLEIRSLYSTGSSTWELGKRFQVDRKTIRDIVNRKIWSHL